MNKNLKICSSLIILFYLLIFEINNLNKTKTNSLNNNNNNNNDDIRFLKSDYDLSDRTNQDDKDSIENCQDSDYFSHFTSGKEFKFEKYVDETDSVIYYYFIIIFL